MPPVFKFTPVRSWCENKGRQKGLRQKPAGILKTNPPCKSLKSAAFCDNVFTWVFPRNSAGIPTANWLVSMIEIFLSVAVYCLSSMFWLQRYKIVLFEAPEMLIQNSAVVEGVLPDYVYVEDVETDKVRAAEFKEVRRIEYMNKMDDVLDDDNLADGFFGSRIGVFGPDPFKWIFCSEKVATQYLPAIVPHIKLTIKLKILKPFFDTWHDEIFCAAKDRCAKDLASQRDEALSQKLHAADAVSSGALLGLLNSKLGGSFCLPTHDESGNRSTAAEHFVLRESGLSSTADATEPLLTPVSIAPALKVQSMRSMRHFSVADLESLPRMQRRGSMPGISVLRSARNMLCDEVEAMQVVRKYWHVQHFNQARRNLFEGLSAERPLDERYAARSTPLYADANLKQEERCARRRSSLRVAREHLEATWVDSDSNFRSPEPASEDSEQEDAMDTDAAACLAQVERFVLALKSDSHSKTSGSPQAEAHAAPPEDSEPGAKDISASVLVHASPVCTSPELSGVGSRTVTASPGTASRGSFKMARHFMEADTELDRCGLFRDVGPVA